MCVTCTLPTYGRLAKRLVRHDPERTPHERVDPAEVRVRAHRQVGGRLPRLLVVERCQPRQPEAELPGVEGTGAIGDRVAHPGRQVAGRLAGRDRVRDLEVE